MKTIIKADNDYGDDISIELTDEDYDNRNFVGLVIKENNEIKGYDVSVEDLYYALLPFYELMKNNKIELMKNDKICE